MNLVMGLAIALGISVLGNGVLAKLWLGAKTDLAVVQNSFDTFKATTKAIGEKAQKEADAKEMADKLRKDTADAENLVKVAGLQRDIERLRRTRVNPGGNLVPAAPADSGRPQLAAFDRGELDRAVRSFEEGIEGLVAEGAKAVVDLDSAKRWAGGKLGP